MNTSNEELKNIEEESYEILHIQVIPEIDYGEVFFDQVLMSMGPKLVKKAPGFELNIEIPPGVPKEFVITALRDILITLEHLQHLHDDDPLSKFFNK